jgi:hypothetical protein
MSDSWKTAGLDPAAVAALADGLPASALWSLLMHVTNLRARRDPSRILDQWKRDGFTAPAAIDQRVFLELDRALLDAAPRFEAVELSPVAPLGSCSSISLTAQNRVLSALRGCEVVADPTNVLALECARRLQHQATQPVRLATAHRCVRAQPFPKRPGFAAHFRIFCLATGTAKGPDHDLLVDALVEHVDTHMRALQKLETIGFAFPLRSVTVFSTAACASLADRVCAKLPPPVARGELAHPYYHGLRFTITAGGLDGQQLPISDGGAFDWLARLTSNRKLVFVASGMGTQLVAQAFRSATPRAPE